MRALDGEGGFVCVWSSDWPLLTRRSLLNVTRIRVAVVPRAEQQSPVLAQIPKRKVKSHQAGRKKEPGQARSGKWRSLENVVDVEAKLLDANLVPIGVGKQLTNFDLKREENSC